jgi:hypothetical protein
VFVVIGCMKRIPAHDPYISASVTGQHLVLMLSQYYLGKFGTSIWEVCQAQDRIMGLCLMSEDCERLLLYCFLGMLSPCVVTSGGRRVRQILPPEIFFSLGLPQSPGIPTSSPNVGRS